jgi:hypothetical protein
MKKIIRLTESELHDIVRNSVNKVLKEGVPDPSDFLAYEPGNQVDDEDEREPLSDIWKRKREDAMMKESINEAESGGWIVDASEAEEAYNMAAAEFGNEELNQAIVRCLGNESLAQCLAYIFRQYDFKQWQSRYDNIPT